MKLLAEAVELARYFFTDDYQYNQEAVAKVLTKPRTEEILQYLAEVVAGAQELQEEELKPLFKQGMEKFGVKMGDLMQPLRVAVTGTNVSPGIYEVLALLGRERVLERIERTIKMLKERS